MRLLYKCLLIMFLNCSHNIQPSMSQFDRSDLQCPSKYLDRLLYSSSSTNCQLECSWFSSSSPKYHNYYNSNENFTYNLNEGSSCDTDSICKSGSCVHLTQIKGVATLTIGECHLPIMDTYSPADGFIEAHVQSSSSGKVYLGQTHIIWDSIYPKFDHDFVSPTVSRDGHFILAIYDFDHTSSADTIRWINVQFTDCNHETMCKRSWGKYYMEYKIEWTNLS